MIRTLQDIIVEGFDIKIIEAGSTIVIDEGLKAIAKSIGDIIKNPGILSSKISTSINHDIHSFIDNLKLDENKRKEIYSKLKVQHNPKYDGTDDSYSTIVTGDHDLLVGMQAYFERNGYESTITRSWDYDIDDLAEIQKMKRWDEYSGDVPEDTHNKDKSKLFISHLSKMKQSIKDSDKYDNVIGGKEPERKPRNKTKDTEDISQHDTVDLGNKLSV